MVSLVSVCDRASEILTTETPLLRMIIRCDTLVGDDLKVSVIKSEQYIIRYTKVV